MASRPDPETSTTLFAIFISAAGPAHYYFILNIPSILLLLIVLLLCLLLSIAIITNGWLM